MMTFTMNKDGVECGRPECNAHGGRSAATAPTMSRRFSNRFSWLRKNMFGGRAHIYTDQSLPL